MSDVAVAAVVVWMKGEIIQETKSKMKETEKNHFYSLFCLCPISSDVSPSFYSE